MTLATYIGSIPGIADGWFSYEDTIAYKELVSSIFNGTIIEIGSYEGLSLYHIKDICRANNNKLISVDSDTARLVKNTLEWEIDLINMPSVEAAELFPDEYFDLVFLDGPDHHKSAVVADIQAWLPKIKKEGIMAGHDFHLSHLKRGIRHWFDIKQITTKGTIWWYREPSKYLIKPLPIYLQEDMWPCSEVSQKIFL
jgi:cephalosporin hydroxylase